MQQSTSALVAVAWLGFAMIVVAVITALTVDWYTAGDRTLFGLGVFGASIGSACCVSLLCKFLSHVPILRTSTIKLRLRAKHRSSSSMVL
jgi:hypothetical protein